MKQRPQFYAGGLAILLSSLVGCSIVFDSQVALVVKADPATTQTKLLELAGGRQAPVSSMGLGRLVENPRFIVADPASPEQLNSIGRFTEVEVVPFRKSQSLLRVRTHTRSALLNSLNSFSPSDRASESAVLRLCADYIERGVKPVRVRVLPYDLWLQQTRTNDFNQLPQKGVPPADWAKPELKLK